MQPQFQSTFLVACISEELSYGQFVAALDAEDAAYQSGCRRARMVIQLGESAWLLREDESRSRILVIEVRRGHYVNADFSDTLLSMVERELGQVA